MMCLYTGQTICYQLSDFNGKCNIQKENNLNLVRKINYSQGPMRPVIMSESAATVVISFAVVILSSSAQLFKASLA